MKLHVGTSGYSYKEWKGQLLSRGLAREEMLRITRSGCRPVEINNTFYRLPQPSMIETGKSRCRSVFGFRSKPANA